ncbi:YHS domain-containing protein [Bosea sp. OAE506]|uniref:YHS domain-containing (seleno)protein n=1 Tax=Bosea sp. OAE506 TaxID=2663870 RepID=UPI00178BC691
MKAGTRRGCGAASENLALRTRPARPVAAIALLVLMALAVPATAGSVRLPAGLPDLPSLNEGVQRDIQSGLALRGYDPIAYRLEGQAVAGDPAYEIVQDGVVWRFVSAANRDAFRDAPAIYTPAFSGYDASAVAEGRAVEIDPREFAIVGSRLFFFRTAENRQRFLADPQLQHRADGLWSSVAQSVAR